MTRIFLSYSRTDQPFAQRIAADLGALGVDVWLDTDDIPAGMKWSSAIQEGLDNAHIMLVLITPASMSSQNVEDEWQYFRDQKKPIVPVLLAPARIHFQLSRLQYVDFHKQAYHTAFKHLKAELVRKGVGFGEPPADPDDTVEIDGGTVSRALPRAVQSQTQNDDAPPRGMGKVVLLGVSAIVVLLIIGGVAYFLSQQARLVATNGTPTEIIPTAGDEVTPEDSTLNSETLYLTKIPGLDWTQLDYTEMLENLAIVYHESDWDGLKDYISTAGLAYTLKIPPQYIGIITYKYKSGSTEDTLQFASDQGFVNEGKLSTSEATLSDRNDEFISLLQSYSWVSVDDISSDGKTVRITIEVDQFLESTSAPEELIKTLGSFGQSAFVESWEVIS